MGGRQSGTVCAKHRCPETGPEMQGLFDSTFRKIYTRDRRGAPLADRLKDRLGVTDVYRVLNDQVWREYLRHRERLRLLRWNCPALEEQVPNGPATHAFCESLRRMGRSRLPHLDSQVAECWLFHGTSFEAAAGIAENDFRLDLTGSNAGTLYGKGIYLAENVSKSDEYGEGPRGTRPEEESVKEDRSQVPVPPAPAHTRGAVEPLTRHSVMLVCRTLLGKVLYNDEVNPSPDAIQRSCLAKGAPYDSVLGDRRKIHGTFREFVYPEFIVVYERIYFHERFQDIFGQMVERCRRRQFQGPSAEEEKVEPQTSEATLRVRSARPEDGSVRTEVKSVETQTMPAKMPKAKRSKSLPGTTESRPKPRLGNWSFLQQRDMAASTVKPKFKPPPRGMPVRVNYVRPEKLPISCTCKAHTLCICGYQGDLRWVSPTLRR
eukprot:g26464.t1